MTFRILKTESHPKVIVFDLIFILVAVVVGSNTLQRSLTQPVTSQRQDFVFVCDGVL